MSRMPTLQEHEARGRNAVLNGHLQDLRKKIGLTRSAMAELLSMSPVTYSRCELPSYAGVMWKTTAERLGRFVWLAEQQVAELEDDGLKLDDLIPLPVIATLAGLPQELLMKWHRDGVIACEDLGILGLWVHREDLVTIGEAVSG